MKPVNTTIKNTTIVRIIQAPLIVLMILLSAHVVTAQVKFTTVVSSQEIGRGEYLQVEFVIENAKQIDQLAPPDFPGFQVAQGPIQSSGMSIVNGNMSQYKSISYVLQPTKTGKFTIGGASATIDGKHLTSNTVSVTVNASSSGGGTGSGSGNANGGGVPGGNPFAGSNWPGMPGDAPSEADRDYILRPGENVKEKIKKNIFVKVQVDKTTCYVGEPIVATYKLYSRLSSESRVTKRPSLNGFSVYDMIDPNQEQGSVEKLNGKAYSVHIIRKTQLVPLQSGTIDLDPVEVENTVHFVQGGKQEPRRSSGNALRDLFDQLNDENAMGPEIEEHVTLDSKPVTITVKALPEEAKPVSFTGAVGSFTIHASLSANSIPAKDEGTLHVEVKGKGNLPVINAPVLSWPAGIDAFDPHAREDINKTTAPISGTKSFDYVFIPGAPGHYTIPAISFSYFDPASQSYKTIATDSIDLQVSPPTGKAASTAVPAASPQQPVQPGGLKKWMQQHLEWIFTILILSGLAFYLLRQNRRLRKTEQDQRLALEAAKKIEQDALEAQARQAMPAQAFVTTTVVVEDPLEEAKKMFESGDYKGFYREVNRSVWKVVTKKLDLPASEMNKTNIVRQLGARGWDSDTTQELESILNECEMNLYTPAYDTYNMQLLLKQAETLLERLSVKR